jgi:hypothetical protein
LIILIIGEDADLFASGSSPTVPSGISSFPDLSMFAHNSLISASPPPPPAAKSPEAQGIDAFPSLEEPRGSSNVRVTGAAGLGEDEELETFENQFPDLSGEVKVEPVNSTCIANIRRPNQYTMLYLLHHMDHHPMDSNSNNNHVQLLRSYLLLHSTIPSQPLKRIPHRSKNGERTNLLKSRNVMKRIKSEGMRCPIKRRNRLMISMKITIR